MSSRLGMPSPIKSRTWCNAFGQVKGELLPFCFKTWDAKSWKKCVHVLKDQVMKGQKSNTDTAKFWTMLVVTTMNQPYVKDLGSVANWDKHEWLDLDSSLELLKNSFASHREKPESLSDHVCQCKTWEAKSWSALKIHYCAKTLSGRPNHRDFADLENDQVWISCSASTVNNHHQ